MGDKNAGELTQKNNVFQGFKKDFIVKVGEKELVMHYELPSSKQEDWLGLNDEKNRPEKQSFMLDAWNKQFPDNPIDDYDFLTGMTSRSDVVKNWFATKSSEFSYEVQVPLFYKEFVTPQEWAKTQKNVLKINAAVASRQEKINILSKKYKEELDALIKDEEGQFSDMKLQESDVIIYITTLSQSQLPITISMSINKYTPVQGSIPTAKAYARECLIRYKTSLLNLAFKNKLSIDQVKKIVEENAVK